MSFIKKQKGFALLYTVVIISLILTIAISISNTTYKQGILSSLAKDSQIAFYQADAGVECGLYYDIVLLEFDAGARPDVLDCGGEMLKLTQEDGVRFLYESIDTDATPDPCFAVSIDKTNAPSTIVQGLGHNTCMAGIRQVERALEATY